MEVGEIDTRWKFGTVLSADRIGRENEAGIMHEVNSTFIKTVLIRVFRIIRFRPFVNEFL